MQKCSIGEKTLSTNTLAELKRTSQQLHWTHTDAHKAALVHTFTQTLMQAQHELEAGVWNILGSGYCVPVCSPKDWTDQSPLSFCVPPQGLYPASECVCPAFIYSICMQIRQPPQPIGYLGCD